ncbi:hypothetical protein HY031_02415 [Candidatus Gottesmanbacteria bacterium]|nr:hypothetical protein [Candidatus Gottesmanbacteria bacterium]
MNQAFRATQKSTVKTKPKKLELTDEQKLARARQLWPELIEAAEKGILEDDQPPITTVTKEKGS